MTAIAAIVPLDALIVDCMSSALDDVPWFTRVDDEEPLVGSGERTALDTRTRHMLFWMHGSNSLDTSDT